MITAGLNEIWWKKSNNREYLPHIQWNKLINSQMMEGTSGDTEQQYGWYWLSGAAHSAVRVKSHGCFWNLSTVKFGCTGYLLPYIRRNKFDYSHTYTIITLLVSLNSELGDINHRRRTTSRSVWNLTALHVCMLRFYIGTVSRLPYLLILMFKLEYVEYHQLVNVVIISLACRASRVWIYSNPLSFITLSFGNAYLLSLLLS